MHSRKLESSQRNSLSTYFIEAWLVNHYYLALILCYVVCVFFPVRPAVMMFAYNSVIILMHLLGSMGTRVYRITSVHVYVFICVLSGIAYFFNEMPSSIFVNSIIYMGTPMVCFFATSNNAVDCEGFYWNFLKAMVFNALVGTICFYTKPQFYVDFIARTSETATHQLLHIAGAGRLVTLFGSIETGILSAIAAIIALGFVIYHKRNNRKIIVALLISVIATVLTQQRGPIFTIFFVVLFLILYSNREKLVKPKIVFLIIVSFIVVMIILHFKNPTVYGWMIERITNPSDAINERMGYQFDVIGKHYNVFQWIFGNGIGSCELFAYELSYHNVILDELYLNILGETGLIGLLTFISIILKCTSLFWKNKRQFFVPMFIVFSISFVGLGTTLIYYPQVAPVFWFSVGFIYNSRNINNCENYEI